MNLSKEGKFCIYRFIIKGQDYIRRIVTKDHIGMQEKFKEYNTEFGSGNVILTVSHAVMDIGGYPEKEISLMDGLVF